MYASGSLHQRAFQAQRRVAQQLDDDSEAKNQFLAAGLSAAAAIGIAVTAPTSAPTAVVVGVDIGASTAISYLSPEVWETGRVLEMTEAELDERVDGGYHTRMQTRIAYLEALSEEVTLDTSGTGEVIVSAEDGVLSIVDAKTGNELVVVVDEEGEEFVVDAETGDQWAPGTSIRWENHPGLRRVEEQADSRVDRGMRVGRREADGKRGGGLEGVEKGMVDEWLNQW